MIRKLETMELHKLRRELKQNSDPQTRESGQRFFKEEVRLYGVKTATAHRISKSHFQHIKDKTKTEIFDLCEELWKSGILEETFVACNWSYYIRELYEPGDFKIFEKWVGNYVTNWASCDTLCNHTIGTFLDMHLPFCPAQKQIFDAAFTFDYESDYNKSRDIGDPRSYDE